MADTAIENLTAVTTMAGVDLLPIVDDPSGVPVTKKISLYQLEEWCSKKGTAVASAGTTVLGDGEYFHITGTTTITDIDFSTSWDGRRARLVFDGILTLTHSATLQLPGKANIVTAPGDALDLVVDTGDTVIVTVYARADGQQIVNPTNTSTAAQSPTANTLTYLTGSSLAIPPSKLKIGSILRWKLAFTKTAAGTAATSFHVRLGTAGNTSDTAVLTFTTPVGTAATDVVEAEIEVICRGPLSASGVLMGWMRITHYPATTGGATTGFIVTPIFVAHVVSSTFNVTTANLIAGLSVTSGASVALTFQGVTAQALNL